MSEIENTGAPEPKTEKKSRVYATLIKDLSIPIAIIIAGAFIGAGFYFSSPANPSPTPNADVPSAQANDTTNKVAPVTAEDHIKGSLDAKVKIVEYSDFECPFCKQFHESLNTIVSDYDEEEVAWVFRQFPLEQLHPVKAMAAAMASECAAELGGNDAFWAFTDGYFANTLTNNRTDIEVLIPKLVKETGVSQAEFQSCFDSNRHTDAINSDIQNAVDTGGRGTPWSVVIGPDGKTYPINGALPPQTVKQLIDSLLAS
jgi:protein-disulfide isomerase